MNTPLSEQCRPSCLSQVAGQEHLLGSEGLLTRIINGGRPLSLLLWGPPGCGKTTLAHLYARAFNARFVTFSAVLHGTTEIKKLIHDLEQSPLFHQQLILFIDEIHRFNKAQQDLFLPFVEKGTITLIGATTENPSFSLNNALLSRLRVLTLNHLDKDALEKILQRYEATHTPLPITSEGREYLIHLSQGDARHLLNLVENIGLARHEGTHLDLHALQLLLQKRNALFDAAGDGHYDLISALHKAVRGSDPDAALYWLARMLCAGEDPQFLCRRMTRMAVEDVGLADPQALIQCTHAWQAYEQLGSPEGDLAIAQAIVYLALAPKSNALYTAFKAAKDLADNTSELPPPKKILNAPTPLMKEQGYGKEYLYDHDTPQGFSGQEYFPDALERRAFYQPVERGFEREMNKRLNYFTKLRQQLNLT